MDVIVRVYKERITTKPTEKIMVFFSGIQVWTEKGGRKKMSPRIDTM